MQQAAQRGIEAVSPDSIGGRRLGHMNDFFCLHGAGDARPAAALEGAPDES